jgi:predicted amidophosphoribosyltransferase
MYLSTIEFGSLLSYSPRGISYPETESRTYMNSLKHDEYISNPPILMSDFVSKIIKEDITTLPFSYFFKITPILVPIPSSSLIRPGTLWVPQRLANALMKQGLGSSVIECLKRMKPLPKAATSLAENRPKATQHYDTIEIQKTFSQPPEEILLVDDVITRGATILGIANKLVDAFPRSHIRAFAAMRTISPPTVFNSVYEPCIGKITLRGEETYRKP